MHAYYLCWSLFQIEIIGTLFYTSRARAVPPLYWYQETLDNGFKKCFFESGLEILGQRIRAGKGRETFPNPKCVDAGAVLLRHEKSKEKSANRGLQRQVKYNRCE